QNADATSGASTSNEETQTADITQVATASNSKDITIQPASDPGGRIENFTVSVLVEDLFAGAVGNVDQGQGGAAQAANADGDTVEISREALLEAEDREEAPATDEADAVDDSEGGEETETSTNGTPLTDSRASGVVQLPETSQVTDDVLDPSREAVTGSRTVPESAVPEQLEESADEETEPAETRAPGTPVETRTPGTPSTGPTETEPGPEAVTDSRSSGIITPEEGSPSTEESEETAAEEESPEAVTDSRQFLGVPASDDSEETRDSDEAVEGENAEADGIETDEEGVTEEDAATDTEETATDETTSGEEASDSEDADGEELPPVDDEELPADGDEVPTSDGDELPADGETTPDASAPDNDGTPVQMPPDVVDPAQAIEDLPPTVNPDELLPSSVVPQDNPTGEVDTPLDTIPPEAPAVEADAPIDTPDGDPTKEGAEDGTAEFNRAEDFAFDFGTPAGIFKAAFEDRFINQRLTAPDGGRNRLEVAGTDLHDQVIGTKGLQQVPISTDVIV
ncbi:MAG: hypothetical protein QF473_03105, partial [Planctomycetota bacterium]|nr:hypothetical protein [Planctomycetota bacterium]